MTDRPISNPASEPEQNITASQPSQAHPPSEPGGDALLDARVAAGEETNSQAPEFADPIATNFSNATGTNAAKMADASGEMGAFSRDDAAQQSTEQGTVQLHNNPDVPDDRAESPQGKLPDTDPIQRPIDPETNLPS